MKALVLGGGGLDGIFANAGAAIALEELGEKYDLLAGTSAGAFIATAIATNRLPLVTEVLETLKPNDLVKSDKPFVDVRRGLRLVRKGCLLDATPLRKLIKETFPDEVIEAVPHRTLFVATFDLRRRRMLEWSPEGGGKLFRDALFASMSVPYVMDTVRFRINNEDYELTDGGVTTTHPVELVLPYLWNAQKASHKSHLTVVSTLSFKDEKDIARKGFKRMYQILKSVKAGFVLERSNSEFDAADEIGIKQTWIQVNTDNLYAEDFTPSDIRQAFADGREAVNREVVEHE